MSLVIDHEHAYVCSATIKLKRPTEKTFWQASESKCVTTSTGTSFQILLLAAKFFFHERVKRLHVNILEEKSYIVTVLAAKWIVEIII